MKKSFEEKLLRERIVDTKQFRYVVEETPNALVIKRIPLEKLDTTAAIDGWEVIKKVEG